MKNSIEYVWDVEFSRAEGLTPFSDIVRVTIDSGDPGGEIGEFESYMEGVLREWFDGTSVKLLRIRRFVR